MKKLLFLLAIPLIAASCNNKQASNQGAINQNQVKTSGQGRVVFSIKDAPPTLQNITAVNVAIDKVELHSLTDAWIVATSTVQTYDLLKLKESGVSKLLADAQVAAGTYDQIRLHITKVAVEEGGTQIQAKLPSNTLKIKAKVVVGANSTASVLLDFDLDKSLHILGNEKIILTPVIKLESKSDASVNINKDNEVEVSDGDIQEDAIVGTDENGETERNFTLDQNAKLDITTSGAIHIESADQSESSVKINAQQATEIALESGQITVVVSVKMDTENGQKVWKVTGTSNLQLKSVYVNAATGAIVRGE